MKPSRGIYHKNVGASLFRRGDRVVNHGRRIGALVLLYKIDARSVAPDGKLLDGGGAERVRSGDDHLFAPGLEVMRYLPDGRGLAHAVDADHKDDGRRRVEDKVSALSHVVPENGAERVFHRPGFRNFVFFDLISEFFDDLLGSLHAHVGADHDLLKFFEKILVHPAERLDHVVHAVHDRFLGLAKSLFQFVKKCHGSCHSPA